MTKIDLSSERNVEIIRRKNVEDNKIFLQKLLVADIRNDFLKSARSVLRKNGTSQIKTKLATQNQRIEHVTRYNEKVKSGSIDPYIPEWQRHIEEKKKEKEKRLLEKERLKLENDQKKKEKEMRLLEKERLKLENKQKKKEKLKQEKRLIYEQKQRDKEINEQEILLERELRKMEKQILKEEKIQMIIANRPPPAPSRWTLYYKNSVNGNPYKQTFKPRVSKDDERIKQALF